MIGPLFHFACMTGSAILIGLPLAIGLFFLIIGGLAFFGAKRRLTGIAVSLAGLGLCICSFIGGKNIWENIKRIEQLPLAVPNTVTETEAQLPDSTAPEKCVSDFALANGDEKAVREILAWLDTAKAAVKASQKPEFIKARKEYLAADKAWQEHHAKHPPESLGREKYEDWAAVDIDMLNPISGRKSEMQNLSPDYIISMFVLSRAPEHRRKDAASNALMAIEYARAYALYYLDNCDE